MQIGTGRYFSPLAGRGENYLINVRKRDGRTREYLVEINPLHKAMHFLFTGNWTRNYVENFAWMVSFYPHDALLWPGEGGRFQPNGEMGFTRGELEALMVQGIGAVIEDFSTRHRPMLLVAVAVRENLGRLYHRLLIRHAAAAGYLYYQTYVQEALYVIEKNQGSAEPAATVRQTFPGRDYRAVAGVYARIRGKAGRAGVAKRCFHRTATPFRPSSRKILGKRGFKEKTGRWTYGQLAF